MNNGSVFPIVLSCLSWNCNFPLNNDFGRKSRLFYDINDVVLSLKEEIEGFYWLDLFFFVCLCVFMHHVLTCCHSLHWVEMIPYVSSTFYRGRLIPPIVLNMCKSSGDKKNRGFVVFFLFFFLDFQGRVEMLDVFHAGWNVIQGDTSERARGQRTTDPMKTFSTIFSRLFTLIHFTQ